MIDDQPFVTLFCEHKGKYPLSHKSLWFFCLLGNYIPLSSLKPRLESVKCVLVYEVFQFFCKQKGFFLPMNYEVTFEIEFCPNPSESSNHKIGRVNIFFLV